MRISMIGVGSGVRRAGAAMLLALALTIVPPAATPARAQGIPTIDFSNLGQNIQQVIQQLMTNAINQLIQGIVGKIQQSIGPALAGLGPFAGPVSQVFASGTSALTVGANNLANDLFKQLTAANCPYCAAGFTPSTVATIDGGTQFTPLTSLNMPAEMVANGNSYGAFTQQQTLAGPPSCWSGVSGCTYMQGTLSSGSSVVVPASSVSGLNIAAGTKFTAPSSATNLNLGTNPLTSTLKVNGTPWGIVKLDPNNPFGPMDVVPNSGVDAMFNKLKTAKEVTKNPNGDITVTFEDGTTVTYGAATLSLTGQGGVDFSINKQTLCAGQSDCTATDTMVNLINCAKNGGNIGNCSQGVFAGLLPKLFGQISQGATAGGQPQPTGAAASPAATYSGEVARLDRDYFSPEAVSDQATIAFLTAKRYELVRDTSIKSVAEARTLQAELVVLTQKCNDIALQTGTDATVIILDAQNNALLACNNQLAALQAKIALSQLEYWGAQGIAQSPIASANAIQ
jgi:hypothetical protein